MGDAHGVGRHTSAHGARRAGVGGARALCACALWALAFIAPAVSESTTALTLVRYAVFGISSALVLLLCRDAPLRQLDTRAWLRIIGLGLTGNTLYFWLMSAGVASAGPIPVALVFGALPVIMTVTANLRRPTVPWRSLAGPGAMVLLGIAVTTASAAADRETAGTSSPVTGMLLALAAAISWVVYGIWNAEHLHDHPATSTTAWASLTGIGTLITLPPFFLAAIGIEGGIRPLATAITPALLGWGLLLGLAG